MIALRFIALVALLLSGAPAAAQTIQPGGGVNPLTSATLQATPTNPAGTASATAVMMGMGATCKLTPVYSTRIKLSFHTNFSNSTAGGTASTAQGRFGTGAAPANGVAASGTTVGAPVTVSSPGAGYALQTTEEGIITGLTPGTAYWFDVSMLTASGTSTIINVDCNATEF